MNFARHLSDRWIAPVLRAELVVASRLSLPGSVDQLGRLSGKSQSRWSSVTIERRRRGFTMVTAASA